MRWSHPPRMPDPFERILGGAVTILLLIALVALKLEVS